MRSRQIQRSRKSGCVANHKDNLAEHAPLGEAFVNASKDISEKSTAHKILLKAIPDPSICEAFVKGEEHSPPRYRAWPAANEKTAGHPGLRRVICRKR